MAGPSRSSSVSLYKDQAQSPSPSLPDEGYDEQRLDIPKWVQHWTDEQRAELAIQLLKSVSPSVFSRSYARLMPLFEYRDFLVLLPYELTVHLLSFLDAQTLANVALVSKAWNKFASDNTVWKTIYFKQGWTVNQDMVDWYLRSAEQEYQWALKHTELETTDGYHGSECSVSHGKRKMEDCDMREAVGRDYSEDYEMMQELHGDRAMYSPRLLNDDEKTLDTYLANSTPFGHSDDIDMARSPGDEYDGGSSPISIPASSPVSRNPSASPEHSPIISSRSRGSSSFATMRTPTNQRSSRFSLTNATFMPSLPRTRLPMYSLGNSLMTPPSMLRKISHRGSPPPMLRIPELQNATSPSTAASPSRPSRFFGHQRASSMDHQRSTSQPTSPVMAVSPDLPNNSSNGPPSPLAAKSLWSVIRHGVMGVSGSGAWPSLHSHRHSDANDPEHSSSSSSAHQSYHHHHRPLSPSLPSWLMHLPSPLASASARYHRSSASPLSPPATTTFQNEPAVTGSNGPKFQAPGPPIPKRIDFQSADAPRPSEILSPHVLDIHRDTISGRPLIDWKFLCKQRRQLERNWSQGIHSARELPGHTEGIYCIQFDEHKIISGSRDNTIKIWDVATGLCLRTYTGHTASVLCLQYDDDRIVSGSSDTTIHVWDLNTGRPLQRLAGHADSVLSLRFENDIVVSCSKDRTVRIWKISTGEMIRTLVGHRAAVNAVQFSPESAAPSPFTGSPRIVVSASGDKTIKIWSFETGDCLRTLEGHIRGIACIQFEGNLVISGSSDKSIKIWDISRGECVKTLVGHEGLVRTLQFSGGRIISGGYDETLKVWDQESGKLLADFKGRHSHRVFKLQFNDSKIVSCSQDQKIIVWDFAVELDTSFLM